jgi:hypothetical protein
MFMCYPERAKNNCLLFLKLTRKTFEQRRLLFFPEMNIYMNEQITIERIKMT